jgi:hypothetical protein
MKKGRREVAFLFVSHYWWTSAKKPPQQSGFFVFG